LHPYILIYIADDKDKVERFASEIYSSLNELKKLSRMDESEFVSDSYKLNSAKYLLIVGIEASIDLCNHLISMNKFREPEGYADTFKVMEEEGIIESEFADRLEMMARFRNRLVHIYWKIDDEYIFKILNENIDDLGSLVENISDHLDSE